MARGGAREGAGRKPGGSNRLTQEAVAQAEAGGEMPLDYLLRVMRDKSIDDVKRIDAAKAAAPYVHAKLQTTTIQGPGGGAIETVQKVERVIVDPANPDS